MLDLHIERENAKETEAEKQARNARQTEGVIAELRQRFPGGRWAEPSETGDIEGVTESGDSASPMDLKGMRRQWAADLKLS